MRPIPRYLEAAIRGDALASGKMAFLSGARQTGKTTIGRALLESPENEFSWDDEEFRRAWTRTPKSAIAERGPGPVLLDEIHKDARWKSKLKGLYDTRGAKIPVIATGSARLDVFRRGGDSLLGRYLPYRVHGFSVGERTRPPTPDAFGRSGKVEFPLEDMVKLGCFPEPLLEGPEARARRWSRLRRERIMREDIRDLRNIQNIRQLELLADLLPDRVGSVLSLNSLREDLHVAHDTVRTWMETLAGVYFAFLVGPYHRKIARAVRSEKKLYLFDYLSVRDSGARFENVIALHLLKAAHYWTDTAQGEFDLHFIRTRDGREVDFLLVRDGKPWMLVEVKSGQKTPTSALVRFARELRTDHNFQLVRDTGVHRRFPDDRIEVISAEPFLAGLV